MRRAACVLIIVCGLLPGSSVPAQEIADELEILRPTGPRPEAKFDVAPSLLTAKPRIGYYPALAPQVADPRTIVFDPYFFPTHYNFRPLPYGYPPTDAGFYYGALANPYYYQYYGPGDYYGF
jgi:hypothetical protein